jgi:hypothetical protein
MPQSQTYLSSLFPIASNKAVVRAKVLTPTEVVSLASALRSDAADYYYSAWISFLDALNGIGKGFHTWATVKLYYAVFYAFRASLALDNVCIFHVNRSAFIVEALAGANPRSSSDAGTHKTVLRAFQRHNPTHPLLSQQIDLLEAVDWLIDQRESANYGRARFDEPHASSLFDHISENGVRRSLAEYVADASMTYTFDRDHAILAYPLQALRLIGSQLQPALLGTADAEEQEFLRSRARDQAGPLALIINLLKQLTLLSP